MEGKKDEEREEGRKVGKKVRGVAVVLWTSSQTRPIVG